MSTQQKPKSTLQKLSKLLNLSETELLIIIRQMGLNPKDADMGWKDAIEQHIKGEKPVSLTGTQAEPEPESFSIEDSEDFVDWGEVQEELGDSALVLVEELGLSQDAITLSDFAALRELALTNPLHQNLAEHIGAVSSIQEGFANEHLRQQFEQGQAIAEAGNAALVLGMLQTQVAGLNEAVQLQTAFNQDLQNLLNSHLERLGNEGKGKPNATVQGLGKKAATAQQSSAKTSQIRHNKLDILAIKKSLK